MAEATISSKNQIVIPREAREALQVKAGDKILVVARGKRVLGLGKPKSHHAAIRGLAACDFQARRFGANSADQRLQRLAEDLRVMIDVLWMGGGRHQGHVVEGRQQNATIHGVEVHEALQFEVHGVVSLGAGARAIA